jgi:hypothetical protein
LDRISHIFMFDLSNHPPFALVEKKAVSHLGQGEDPARGALDVPHRPKWSPGRPRGLLNFDPYPTGLTGTSKLQAGCTLESASISGEPWKTLRAAVRKPLGWTCSSLSGATLYTINIGWGYTWVFNGIYNGITNLNGWWNSMPPAPKSSQIGGFVHIYVYIYIEDLTTTNEDSMRY